MLTDDRLSEGLVDQLKDRFTVLLVEEQARWKARDVRYVRGIWEAVKELIPTFELGPFATSDEEPHNPYLQSVIRLPVQATERPMPVGVVSRSYTLVQHRDLGEMCLSGLRRLGLAVDEMECEVGLSDLGEWMNLRLYFPDQFSIVGKDGFPVRLRLEAFNSVDGSCRLKVCLGWLRLVCANGLIIGRSLFDASAVHNRTLDLKLVEQSIGAAIAQAENDRAVMERWAEISISETHLRVWVDGPLAKAWGKKAATRVWHICTSGADVEIVDPFDGSAPSEKPVAFLEHVPGAPPTATNLYDVAQALSWIATARSNAEHRVEWQSGVARLIQQLHTPPSRGGALGRRR